MMKKILLFVVAMFVMSSCSTVYKTASTRDVSAPIVSAAYADLEVSNSKISYTLRPSPKISRGGVQNCINVAINEALKENGGDVLIETQNAIVSTRLFGLGKVKSVTVTGYPATYKNFRKVDQATLESALENGAFESSKSNSKTGGLFSIF